MPHSSGGGSSRSGVHYSSHRSSSSRSSSSYSYTPSYNRFSYPKSEPVYLSTQLPRKSLLSIMSKRAKYATLVVLVILFIIFAIAALGLRLPTPVKVDYNSAVVIDDKMNALSYNEIENLTTCFKNFQNKTGVLPALTLIPTSYWQSKATSLEDFAYNDYISKFKDEKHWLVVFAYEGDREKWEWEGMIGDDCGSIIPEYLEDSLTTKIQNNLWASSHHSIATAITQAFDDVKDSTGHIYFAASNDQTILICCAIFLLFMIVVVVINIVTTPVEYDINKAQLNEVKPETGCPFCGCYMKINDTRCPSCGAPVPHEEE